MNPSNINVLSSQTLQTIIAWKEVMLQIDISFMTVEISTSVPLILGNIMLMTNLPVDKEKVGSLQLGSISHTANIFPCVSSSFYSLPVLAQFVVTISDISTP